MAEFLTASDKRTCYCAELSEENIGQKVCVMGWVQRQRDLGALIFIDLRDRTGIVQLAYDDTTDREVFAKAASCRAEYVVCVKGTVRRRDTVNPNIPTGNIEVYAEEIRRTPAHDALVKTEDGIGKVISSNPLAGTIRVILKDDPDAPPKQYHRDSVTVLERERRAPQEKKSDRGEKGEKSVKDAEKNGDKAENNGEKIEKND